MRNIGKKGRFLWLLPLAAVIAFAAIACSSAEEAAPAAPAPAAPAPAAPAPAAPAATAVPAAPAPAAAPESTGGGTLTAVMDNVGSPLFRNEKATWPDNMMNYYYGFQELLATWERQSDGSVNDASCEAPMLAISWEYDLPPNFDERRLSRQPRHRNSRYPSRR